MPLNCKYVHTNIIARDWRRLARFYIQVFGCREKPPERNLSGTWLDRATALKKAHIEGIHLYLPGYDEHGPTLEIFQYSETIPNNGKLPNKQGFGHIAFSVDDVERCVELIQQHGGGCIGETVHTEISGAGTIHFAYAHDPEGNIVEIQKWEGA